MATSCGSALVTSSTTGHDPYPYTKPTPPYEPTALDGFFARSVTPGVLGPAGGCRRCPPYRLALGDEILGLENGVFRVFHGGSGYMSVGHYLVDAQEVTLFNDPNCPKDRGTYEVSDEGEWRSFHSNGDQCAFDLVRERFLTSLPWRRVEPPEGIYESPEGLVIVLLGDRFALWSNEVERNGVANLGKTEITIEVDECRQTYEWSFADRRLELNQESQGCDADWVDSLSESEWLFVG